MTQRDRRKTGGSPVGERRDCPSSTPDETASAPGQQPGTKGRKTYPKKARFGNVSALKHGAYLTRKKHEKRLSRDRFRRMAEREAREVVKAYSLAKDPLARILGRELANLISIRLRLTEHHERRGYFRKDQELKPSVGKELETSDRLVGEVRRLLEARAGQPLSGDVRLKVIHVCEFKDGRAAPPGGYGPHVEPLSLDPPAPEPAAPALTPDSDDEWIH
jgi:hypothetical protein